MLSICFCAADAISPHATRMPFDAATLSITPPLRATALRSSFSFAAHSFVLIAASFFVCFLMMPPPMPFSPDTLRFDVHARRAAIAAMSIFFSHQRHYAAAMPLYARSPRRRDNADFHAFICRQTDVFRLSPPICRPLRAPCLH